MFLALIVLFCYSGVVHSSFKYNYGRIADSHIIGGKNASIEEFPYQADLGYCGGAIIGQTWILTAAHCGPVSIVRLGSSLRREGIKYRVAKRFIHPAYHIVDNIAPMYDIQLLKLQKNIEFDKKIATIPIGNADNIHPGEISTVSGWGMTSNGRHSVSLLHVNVKIIHDSECQKIYGKYFNEATFCAGDRHNDACDGDSGGPLVSNGKLIGIVSFGYVCGSKDYPGVYAKIPTMAEWIRNITNEH